MRRRPRTSAWRRTASGFLAAALLAGCAALPEGGEEAPVAMDPPAELVLSRERLTAQFARIAFSAEFGGEGRRGRLAKWVAPVSVGVMGPGATRHRGEVAFAVGQVAQATGHPIRLLPTWQGYAANLKLRFVQPGAIARAAGVPAPCYTEVLTLNGTITQAEVLIWPGHDDLVAHCVVEELAQAFGFLDDSTLVAESIFNDDSRRASLAPTDALLLGVLYDDSLVPGMAAAEALPIARELIEGRLARLAQRR